MIDRSVTATSTPFTDLDDYLALRRVSGLALSPDGSRLVVSVAALDEKRTAYVNSLWEVDPAGQRAARRLTWGPKSETAPAFLSDGSLIFTSARPEPDHTPPDEPTTTLWLLPATGGEARPLATRPGGIGAVAVARDVDQLVLASATLPSSTTAEEDGERRKARKEAKVSAVLHDSYPVRYWDADLGPDRDRLFTATVTEADDQALELRDLTGFVGGAIGSESRWTLAPDGTSVVVGWQQPEPGGSARYVLVALDIKDGSRRVLLDDPAFEHLSPVFSPDGTRVAVTRERRSSPEEPIDQRICILHLDSGELHDAAPGWDRWPSSAPVWTPDGGALLVAGDDGGRGPIWRIDLDTRTAARLTGDDAAYTDLQLSRDGTVLYALRSAIGTPPAPVRLDPAALDQQPIRLLSPVADPEVPGRVVEVSTQTEDGATVRGWLVLPTAAGPQSPVPLLLWVHGGPLGSWNAWSWRWNPWLAAAKGYAVLLPDPALSTGYGLASIKRSWGRWGSESYTDTMAITDAAVGRDDIDADRTAAMGGSYGGYMVNWIAGHTDRFRGIVSHAGLWALDQFGPTTDAAYYWRREMTAVMEAENSPHHFADQIRTPMLVIHGDRDYRVPIAEALRLWTDLAQRGTAPDGVLPHRFLVFPDENHWVLKPQHAKIWYQSVFAFLAHTVLGEPWQVPDLLR
jgi:dipeptidyl aminopeptidase/acylaminoacyl peptidase